MPLTCASIDVLEQFRNINSIIGSPLASAIIVLASEMRIAGAEVSQMILTDLPNALDKIRIEVDGTEDRTGVTCTVDIRKVR